MIHIDTREPDDLIAMIEDVAEETNPTGMDTGDFIVQDWAIERKRYSDIVSRMKSTENSIFTQMLELEAFCDEEDMKPVLLLEGNIEFQLSRTEITVQQVQGVIASLFKMDIYMLPTAGKEETAYVLSKLEEDTTGAGPRSIRDTASVPMELYPRYLTEGFNKVGPKTAVRLLDKFGSFQNVVNADVSDLKDVHGVGTKTAEHIYEVVRQEWEEDVEIN